MDFDLVLDANTFLNEELKNVASVISLELNDCSPIFVLNCCSIAAPGLLEGSFNLLTIQVIWQALHQCEAFS